MKTFIPLVIALASVCDWCTTHADAALLKRTAGFRGFSRALRSVSELPAKLFSNHGHAVYPSVQGQEDHEAHAPPIREVGLTLAARKEQGGKETDYDLLTEDISTRTDSNLTVT